MKSIISLFLYSSLVYGDEIVENSNTFYTVFQLFLFGYFIIMIITIFKGYGEKRTLIIFRDYNDLGLTILIPASVYLIFFLFISFGGNQQLALALSLGVGFILFGLLVRNTYLDNNKSVLYMILVLLTKMPLGILWFLNLLNLLNPSGKTSIQRSKARGSALIILSILTPILHMLVVNKEGSLFNPKDWVRGNNINNIKDYL